MDFPNLWQFNFSHYNEKARWALDHKQIRHKRTTFLPGTHVLPALMATGSRTLPILKTKDKAIADSTAIIAWLEEHHPSHPLYPEDPDLRQEALDWEEDLDEHFGVATRQLGGDGALSDPAYLTAALAQSVSAPFNLGIKYSWPLIALPAAFARGFTQADLAGARKTIETTFDRIEARIADHKYLVGKHFSVADLTAASLALPIVIYPQFKHKPEEPVPASLQEVYDAYEDRPAVHWLKQLYHKHRGLSYEVD